MVTADRFRCHACGHWCRPTEFGWTCSKRGGCGNEYQTEEQRSEEMEFWADRYDGGHHPGGVYS